MIENSLQPIAFPLAQICLRGLSNGNHGKPIVLALHGWLDNANSFIPIAEYFNEYHFIAIDWPGHGYSDHRPLGCDYQQLDYVDDLHQLIEEQGWRELVLLGHSMGGILSTIYAGVFPERVAAVVSIDACGPLYGDKTLDTIRQGIEGRQQRRKRHKQGMAIPFGKLLEKRQEHTELPQPLVELLLKRSVKPTGKSELDEHAEVEWLTDDRLRNSSLLRLTQSQAQDLMAAIESPLMVIVAKQGLLAQRGKLEQRLDWFKQVRVETLDGGHHLHMQFSKQVFEKISKFLTELQIPVA